MQFVKSRVISILLLSLFSFLLLNSCNKNDVPEKIAWNPEHQLNAVLSGFPDYVKEAPPDIEQIDAVHCIFKSMPKVIIDKYNTVVKSDHSHILKASYNVNGFQDEIVFTKLNNKFLEYVKLDFFPTLYATSVNNDSNFAPPGSEATWAFMYFDHDTINSSIKIPKDLQNLRLKDNKLTLTDGGALIWDNPDENEEIYAEIKFMSLNNNSSNTESKNKCISKVIRNTGVLTISRDEINELNPANKFNQLAIDLFKVNKIFEKLRYTNYGMIASYCITKQVVIIEVENNK